MWIVLLDDIMKHNKMKYFISVKLSQKIELYYLPGEVKIWVATIVLFIGRFSDALAWTMKIKY